MRRLAAAVVVAGAVGLVIWLGFLRDPGPGPLADNGGGVSGLSVTPGHTVVLDYQLRRPLSAGLWTGATITRFSIACCGRTGRCIGLLKRGGSMRTEIRR